jgi:hypothetical protein
MTRSVALMHGLWRDGRRHVHAVVDPLKGSDEVILHEGDEFSPAACTTRLLSAATRAIGDVAPVDAETIRALSVADRERLLLALNLATFGRRLELVTQCASCDAQIEISLDLTVLAEAGAVATAAAGPAFEVAVETPSGQVRVRCRAPNGADQEALVALARRDVAAAADALLLRSIESVRDDEDVPVAADGVLDWLREPVGSFLEDADPLTDLRLTIACPDCGHEAATSFDAFFFLRLASTGRGSIFADVDRLARAYHWSEADILALPLARRRLYLSLLDDAGGAR